MVGVVRVGVYIFQKLAEAGAAGTSRGAGGVEAADRLVGALIKALVVGAAIAVEKAFQPGGARLRAEGMRIGSLAKIASMSDDGIVFCEE